MTKILDLLTSIFKPLVTTYGSELEYFILSHNPQNTGDVERLAIRYQHLNTRRIV